MREILNPLNLPTRRPRRGRATCRARRRGDPRSSRGNELQGYRISHSTLAWESNPPSERRLPARSRSRETSREPRQHVRSASLDAGRWFPARYSGSGRANPPSATAPTRDLPVASAPLPISAAQPGSSRGERKTRRGLQLFEENYSTQPIQEETRMAEAARPQGQLANYWSAVNAAMSRMVAGSEVSTNTRRAMTGLGRSRAVKGESSVPTGCGSAPSSASSTRAPGWHLSCGPRHARWAMRYRG